MHDGGKIITGLIVFLILITFPIWYNVVNGKPHTPPDPKIVTSAKECVMATQFMKTNHMNLLNDWRDMVVRKGDRFFIGEDGNRYEMSLSNTCMSCHPNKAEFCDQCHNYMDVNPYCWDCHIEPKEPTQ
jgi:hypothetical protein